jgi:dTDP-4-amino-4,6-dideoxygalactose transaminase
VYGEGGAIFTDDEILAGRCKTLRSHGASVRYYHDEVGYNYRMEGFQAAVLDVKLDHIDRWNARRQEIAHTYRSRIINARLQFQQEEPGALSVYHLFVVMTEDRSALEKHLEEAGVGFAFHYPVPCHLQKAYAHLGYKEGDFPVAEHQAAHCLSLPMFPEMTDAEVDRVVEVLNQY